MPVSALPAGEHPEHHGGIGPVLTGSAPLRLAAGPPPGCRGAADDVVGAVRLARREGLRIAVRSGGHSWSASHLRDGTVLIDLSNLRHVAVDREAMTGTAQPGIKGSEFSAVPADQNLFFPTGHCSGVSLGGYLLQGGFAWAGRDYGPACMSGTGIDATARTPVDGLLRGGRAV
ncbi:FAD-dependent oxidoreductase [Streptomyces sp. NPDC048637]|uniref:FAD-binding oxidoreductase n=1 Tax=Streptomyces sp. NPDC048637 TaxID=3155636 RepID=UPI00341B1D21